MWLIETELIWGGGKGEGMGKEGRKGKSISEGTLATSKRQGRGKGKRKKRRT